MQSVLPNTWEYGDLEIKSMLRLSQIANSREQLPIE